MMKLTKIFFWCTCTYMYTLLLLPLIVYLNFVYNVRSLKKTPSSHSSGLIAGMTSPDSKETGSPRKVIASEDNVQSGFSVGGSHQVNDVGRLGQPSTLTEETPKSQDFEINKGSSPLINEEPESLEALGGDPFANSNPSSPTKNSAEEQNRKQSETADDDLSPWKKPKPPVSLTVPPPPPPPMAKISTNPFDGLEDDHLQKEPVGVAVGGAQIPSANSGMENGNGVNSQLERRSHDRGAISGAAAVSGRNPFDDDIARKSDDITGKNPFDDGQFEYGYEEPKPTVEVPGTVNAFVHV